MGNVSLKIGKTTLQKTGWNQFYRDGYFVEHWPTNSVVRFLMRRAKKRDVKKERLLDVGCGGGRHTWLATSIGFRAFGIEISQQALNLAKKRIYAPNSSPVYKIFDGKTIPFSNELFSTVICYGVLDHMKNKEAYRLIKEIRRVLIPHGELFVKLRSDKCINPDDIGVSIEKNTYLIESECERNLIQHFFSWDDVIHLLKDFTITEAELEEQREILNSSKIIDSRWNLVVQKQ